MTLMNPADALNFLKGKDIQDYYIRSGNESIEQEAGKIKIEKKGWLAQTWLGKEVKWLFSSNKEYKVTNFATAAISLIQIKDTDQSGKEVKKQLFKYAKRKFNESHKKEFTSISDARDQKQRFLDLSCQVGKTEPLPLDEKACLPIVDREKLPKQASLRERIQYAWNKCFHRAEISKKYNLCVESTCAFKGKKGSYYHANHLTYQNSHYIAAQYPFTTVQDGKTCPNKENFVKMCWESNTGLIVDLTQSDDYLKDSEFLKPYFSETQGEQVKIGSFTVTCTGKETKDQVEGYTLYTYEIRQGTSTKTIHRVHYTNWMDKEALNQEDFEKLIKEVNSDKKRINDQKPSLIHCIRGVGRTGTFIVLNTILNRIEAGEITKDNVYDKIDEIIIAYRKQRGNGIIQKVDQYKSLVALAEKKLGIEKEVKVKEEPKVEEEVQEFDFNEGKFEEVLEAFMEIRADLQPQEQSSFSIQHGDKAISILPHPSSNPEEFWNDCLKEDFSNGRLFIDLSTQEEGFFPIKVESEKSINIKLKNDQEEIEADDQDHEISLRCDSIEKVIKDAVMLYDYTCEIKHGEDEPETVKPCRYIQVSSLNQDQNSKEYKTQIAAAIKQAKEFITSEDFENSPSTIIYGNQSKDANVASFSFILWLMIDGISDQEEIKEKMIENYPTWIEKGGLDFIQSKKDFEHFWKLSLAVAKEL